jgi:phosphoribosylformylglycinamidine cyclo-ligase
MDRKNKITYKKAGVDIKKAERFIKKIKLEIPTFGAFGSLFPLKNILKEYKEPYLVASSDGVGTKLKLAAELNIHKGVGIDLVAMNVNDIICLGAKPLFFLDYIACGKLNLSVLKEIIKGIKRGLKDSNCLLLGGETAEMPGMYREDEYDLAGFCVGIVDKDKIIDGRCIKEKDLILGIASSGLHSNGFSLVRKIFSKREIKKYAHILLKPTRIYVKPVINLVSSINIKGIAHITGGAFYHKAIKILPKKLGMLIDKKTWKVPEIFKIIQKKANLPDTEMYSVFNMGIGMIFIVGYKQAKKALNFLNKFYPTYLIGEVLKMKEKIVLR